MLEALDFQTFGPGQPREAMWFRGGVQREAGAPVYELTASFKSTAIGSHISELKFATCKTLGAVGFLVHLFGMFNFRGAVLISKKS